MFEVSKIMNRDVVSVNSHTHVYDAMNLLIENRISGLPVVDDENNLIGIISEKDMLGLLVEREISKDQLVGDFMTRNVKTFAPEDSIIDISEFFISSHVRRVPIVKEGKLAGVISRADIIKLIVELRGQSHDG